MEALSQFSFGSGHGHRRTCSKNATSVMDASRRNTRNRGARTCNLCRVGHAHFREGNRNHRKVSVPPQRRPGGAHEPRAARKREVAAGCRETPPCSTSQRAISFARSRGPVPAARMGASASPFFFCPFACLPYSPSLPLIFHVVSHSYMWCDAPPLLSTFDRSPVFVCRCQDQVICLTPALFWLPSSTRPHSACVACRKIALSISLRDESRRISAGRLGGRSYCRASS